MLKAHKEVIRNNQEVRTVETQLLVCLRDGILNLPPRSDPSTFAVEVLGLLKPSTPSFLLRNFAFPPRALDFNEYQNT
jgi:hypothetical protein